MRNTFSFRDTVLVFENEIGLVLNRKHLAVRIKNQLNRAFIVPGISQTSMGVGPEDPQ